MSTTLTALITSCRLQNGDGPMDNYMRSENLNSTDSGNVIDGSNVTFNVKNFPVSSFVSVVADNISTSFETQNIAIGQFTLPAPPTTSVYVSYYYQLFDDTSWTEFINSGLEMLNLSVMGDPNLDVPAVPNGLLGALKMFASYYFCNKVAKQTGLWYNQRLQERVDDRDNISKKWSGLADASLTQALKARDDYYSGAGTSHSPTVNIVQHQPRPWTPYR